MTIFMNYVQPCIVYYIFTYFYCRLRSKFAAGGGGLSRMRIRPEEEDAARRVEEAAEAGRWTLCAAELEQIVAHTCTVVGGPHRVGRRVKSSIGGKKTPDGGGDQSPETMRSASAGSVGASNG